MDAANRVAVGVREVIVNERPTKDEAWLQPSDGPLRGCSDGRVERTWRLRTLNGSEVGKEDRMRFNIESDATTMWYKES